MTSVSDPEKISKRHRFTRGLYALADADVAQSRGLHVVDCALAMQASGIAALQLRAKGRGAEEVMGWMKKIVAARSGQSPPFIQNDRADLAMLMGADGVHVGQDDLPVRELSTHYPSLLRGISTHDLSQLNCVLNEALADYVAFGPVFSTSSKKNAEPAVGLKLLQIAHHRSRKKEIPLVAIGGVTEDNMRTVAERCDLVAAIGLLLPPCGTTKPYSYIEKQCTKIHQLIREIEPLNRSDFLAVHDVIDH